MLQPAGISIVNGTRSVSLMTVIPVTFGPILPHLVLHSRAGTEFAKKLTVTCDESATRFI